MIIATVFASIAVYVAVGLLVGRKVRTKSDYYVAGRKAPTLLVAGSLVAGYMSAVGFTGDIGLAYDGYPILLLILMSLSFLGYVVGPLVFGRYLRRADVLTIPEFLGRRFDSPGFQALAGLTVIIGIGIYLLAVTQGLGLLFSSLLGLDFGLSLLLLWACYTTLTLASGSPGVLVTDTIMFLVFTAAAILCMTWLIVDAGGPYAIAAHLAELTAKPDSMLPHGLTGPGAYMGTPTDALLWAVIFGFVWAIVVTVSPWQSSRYMMAKNEHVAIRSGAVSAAVMLVFYVPLAFGSLAINVVNPMIEPSTTAFIWAATEYLPVWLGAIAIAGIAAAGLSSATTFLSLVGFSVSHDITPFLARGRKHAPTENGVAGTRLSILVVGIAVLVVAYVTPPAILDVAYIAGTLFAASWGPVCILAVHVDWITKRGAVAGMSTGFVSVLVLEALDSFTALDLPMYLHPAIVGFVLCSAATVLGSLGQPRDVAGVDFRRAIMRMPAEERDVREVRRTKPMIAGLAGVSLVTIAGLFLTYFLPVSAAIG